MKNKYEFSLVLASTPKMTEELADILYGAGCDDATIVERAGVAIVHFDRMAESLEEAIRLAVAHVQSAGCTVEHLEIDADAEIMQI